MELKITILYDIIRWEEKAIFQAAKKKGLDVEMVDVRKLKMDTHSGYPNFGDVVMQRSVSYYRSLHSTAFVEFLGYRIVNSLNASIIAGNKFFTTLALKRHGVPTPRTIVALSPETALQAFEDLGGRAVIKPVLGSWGRLVALLDGHSSAKAIIEDREMMYPMYQVYYLQEYIKRPPRDIRTFVIGDQVVAAIYRYQPSDDWRTNTSRGGKAVKCEVTKELEEISLKAAEAIGEGIYGVDLMESEDGLVVHEVNNTTEFRNTIPATGVDIPGIMIDYLRGLARR